MLPFVSEQATTGNQGYLATPVRTAMREQKRLERRPGATLEIEVIHTRRCVQISPRTQCFDSQSESASVGLVNEL